MSCLALEPGAWAVAVLAPPRARGAPLQEAQERAAWTGQGGDSGGKAENLQGEGVAAAQKLKRHLARQKELDAAAQARALLDADNNKNQAKGKQEL